MNILFTISESYVPYCGVTIQSLINSNPTLNIDIYVVALDISEHSKNLLSDLIVKHNSTYKQNSFKIFFPEILPELRKSLQSMTSHLKFSHNTSYILRLYADRILPKDIDKILYTDVDIIFNDSIKELDDYTFSPHISIAAVKDLVRYDDYKRLGITSSNHVYVNSGVILINLKYWRENEIGEKCIQQLIDCESIYTMPDQDAINFVLQGTVDYLHPKYNCLVPFCARREFLKARVRQEEFDRVQEATKNPAIIHYVFANKPWFKSEYLPFRHKWLETLAQTPWKNMKISYKNGIKGCIKIYTKQIIQLTLGCLGIDFHPSIFYKKRYKHIQVLFLLLYYGIGQWLPDSWSPFGGRFSNLFRRWCVQHLFDYVGTSVNIGRRTYFGKGEKIWIGSKSNLGAYCHISNNIIIGENVMMGPHNYFFENVKHRFDDVTIPMIKQGVYALNGRIEIGDDVWIGRECMVMPGKKIGSHSIVGARSLVTKDVEEWTIVGGNPAKIIRKRK